MDDKFLSVKDVAKILGISKMTIYRYIDEGKLKAVKTRGEGGRVVVPASALADFIRKNSTTTVIEKIKRNKNEIVRILKECEDAEYEVLKARLKIISKLIEAA